MGRTQHSPTPPPQRSTFCRHGGEALGVSGGQMEMKVSLVLLCYTHIQSSSSCFKKCRKVESEHVDLTKCLRRLRVPVGHKREVARYRDRRQGHRFTNTLERSETC